jgi:hypothetical protein
MKLQVPDGMREKINNTSWDQVHGSLSEHMTTWRAAQTYLRSKYLLHVQDKFGKIPYAAIGGGESHGGTERSGMATVRYADRSTYFSEGNAAFEDFAFGWIDDRVADPSHPEHETAKQFQKEGVFMDVAVPKQLSGRAQGDNERSKGQQHRYERYARSHRYLMSPEGSAKHGSLIDGKISLAQRPIYNDVSTAQDLAKRKITVQIEKMAKIKGNAKWDAELTTDQFYAIDECKKEIGRQNAQLSEKRAKASDEILLARKKVVANFVPPGMEALYSELDFKHAEARTGRAPLPLNLNTGQTPKPAESKDSKLGLPRNLADAVRRIKNQGPIAIGSTEPPSGGATTAKIDPQAPQPNAAAQAMAAGQQSGSADVDIPIQGQKAAQSPAAAIESSKQLRAQEVALSHHGKMLKDAKRDLKRMKRGVPEERKAKLQGKVKALDAQYKQMQDKFGKLQGGK